MYHSHIGQDQWVAEVYRGQRDGYFLDFGAFDGRTTSNTFFLEKNLGWNGICVEPHPLYFAKLCEVRSCIAVNSALWPISRLSLQLHDAHGLSRLAHIAENDANAARRLPVTQGVVLVDTLNPVELLQRFNAPSEIHYLSLDAEGAEVAIIEAMDFYKFHFGLLSIEHNHDQFAKDTVRHIMAFHGYECCELRNDDLFFNVSVLHGLSHGRCEDPRHVRERVFNSYNVE